MKNYGPAKVAHMFADAISHQNLDKISELMDEEHVFIDSLGMRIEGRAAMGQGWEGYFRMVPDYSITIQEILVKGPTVVMLGTAQGTYSANGVLKPENHWSTPTAWRALIRGSFVAEWQVSANNEPIRPIITKY